MKKTLREVKEKSFEAGGGVWFRNSDNKQLYVEVRFYPKTRLYLHNGPVPVKARSLHGSRSQSWSVTTTDYDYEEHNMKKLISGFLLAVISLIVLIGDIYVYVHADYEYENSVSSYWILADKSSTIPKKAEYIDKFVVALEAQHLEGQHNAAIFPTLDNSFDRNLEALKTLQLRLHEIEKMDVTSFPYQTAIQQITAQEQGEAQAMLKTFEGVWWKQRHFFLWEWVGVINWIGTVVGIIVGAVLFGFGWAAVKEAASKNRRRY